MVGASLAGDGVVADDGVVGDGGVGVGLGGDGLGGVTASLCVGGGVVSVGEGAGLGVEGTSDSVGDGVRVRDGVGSPTDRDGVGIETESVRDGAGRLAAPSHDAPRSTIPERRTRPSIRDVSELPLRAIRAMEAHRADRLGIRIGGRRSPAPADGCSGGYVSCWSARTRPSSPSSPAWRPTTVPFASIMTRNGKEERP